MIYFKLSEIARLSSRTPAIVVFGIAFCECLCTQGYDSRRLSNPNTDANAFEKHEQYSASFPLIACTLVAAPLILIAAVADVRGGIRAFLSRIRSTVSKLVLLSVMLGFASNTEGSKAATIMVSGGSIDVFAPPEKAGVAYEHLIEWVRAASKSVATYFGRYPVPHVAVRITAAEGRGVQNGMTFGSPSARITISVGRDTSLVELESDWTMTHEMVHLAFPSMAKRHHWIEEGIATYVEPVARVRAGYLAPSQMWSDLVRDLPQGQPRPGDQGLDVTHSWGRTYWGGALFCLLADVEIHQRTHNQKGLEDALRGILAAGGNITEDWPLERALTAGDEATGTRVLESLYEEMKDKPVTVNLTSLWKQLGIQRLQNGDISFTDDAPLASVRNSIAAGTGSRYAAH